MFKFKVKIKKFDYQNPKKCYLNENIESNFKYFVCVYKNPLFSVKGKILIKLFSYVELAISIIIFKMKLKENITT